MIYTDVSYWQNQPSQAVYKPIDWQKMKRQADGVIIRAGYGSMLDRQFVRNWADSKDIIQRGAYWYFLANVPAKQQAETLLRWATEPELFLAIDCEWRQSTDGIASKPVIGLYVEQVYEFLTTLENAGHSPWVYSNWSTILSYLPRPLSSSPDYEKWLYIGRCNLWLAQYETSKKKTLAGPNVPEPWIDWDLWQVTDKGPGFGYGVHSASIDLNRVHYY